MTPGTILLGQDPRNPLQVQVFFLEWLDRGEVGGCLERGQVAGGTGRSPKEVHGSNCL